jgi:hypothetical protein
MRRRLVVVACALVAVWAVVAAMWLVRIAFDLRAARDAASSARDHLGAEEIANRRPLPDLKTAARRFGSAHDRANGLLLAPLRIVPVVGRQLHSVRALSSVAEGVARLGIDGVERAGKVIDHPAPAGAARVAQVREIRDIADDLAVRLGDVGDFGPLNGLLAPLADARNQLASDIADVQHRLVDARAAARAALSLVTGPRRYLVVAANNAEMRAGSGMWLQGGILDAKDGELELERMISLPIDADPPTGAVSPTGDLAARWGFLQPGDEWRSLMASPRFEDSARLAAEMWRATGRGEVDGVIAVDAIGLQAIVEATGPARAGAATIAAGDVPTYVLHDQYAQFADVSQLGLDNAARKEALGVLAESAVEAINRGDYPASTLIRTLGTAIEGRHLLAWSTVPEEADGWVVGGMDGRLGADSLLVSLLNIGANKLDWFLGIDASLAVERSATGWDVAVELHLTNRTPDGEPRYVTGPLPTGLASGEYRGILAVNVPGEARNSRFDGVPALAVVGADGPTRVVGFPLGLPAAESRTVVLRFSLPRSADHVVVEPSARVPGIRWRYGSSSWQDTSSRTANWR